MTAIEIEVAAPSAGGRSPRALFWERFKRDKAALVGGVVVILLLFLAFFGGPLATEVTGHGSNDIYSSMTDDFGVPRGPNSDFWFGADAEGHDLFVRTMYGARASLIVGVLASVIAVLIGGFVGIVAGFFRGWVDGLFSRVGDVMLAVPALLLAIGISAACTVQEEGCLGGTLKQGLGIVIVVITLFTWPYIARLVRGVTLSLREKEFVEASRSVGAGNFRIIFREVLPNLAAPIIVYLTLLIPTNILFEAALSFLGLGLPITQASWGQLLSEASQLYDVAWWLMVFPGLFLVTTTLAFNLLGDGLRDALDVRSDR